MIPNKVGVSYGQDFKVITAPFVKSNLFHRGIVKYRCPNSLEGCLLVLRRNQQKLYCSGIIPITSLP